MVSIDHITKCQVDPEVGSNELTTLRYLGVGLYHLYVDVVEEGKPFREKDEKNGRTTMTFGNIPSLREDAVHLLPCFFHWYGVSLMNYARLVGFLSGLSCGAFTRHHLEDDNTFQAVTEHCNSYVSSVPELSAIKVWRDKVAGHFAITAPKKSTTTLYSLTSQ